MSAPHESASNEQRRHRVEGPRNHYITFVISILLTMLAFAAVAFGDLDPRFVISFIVVLAIVQAVFQLAYWMHMKDRGHNLPILFIFTGGFVALLAVISAIYWMWW